ncbi:PEP-CTERM motif protein [Rubripirellula obstinata]|uniref:PEP-CTERM motif protein n=1 Tax=Rubripirellula obstinata TaxID=406547 RepID=A0A5B1CRI4_9BACT|nr:PEP-CTERM sorting domain-containing protein [Rubripirellula obstinata]KAA1261864.1 PEP-CTERM motif protein [Rubripirellula obstinata]
MIRFFLAFTLGVLVFASSSEAGIILGNTFDGSTTGDEFYSTGQVIDPNVTSPGVVRPGYIRNGGFDALVAAEIRTFTTAPDVLDFTRFFGFTITPIGGSTINFSDFTYTGFETLAAGATEGASKFALRSDIIGFGGGGDIGVADLDGETIDLSGAAYQNITSPVEFRLYIQAEDGADTSPNSTYSLDSFAFNGTVVAIPEPSSFALFAFGGVAVVARRRRRSIA